MQNPIVKMHITKRVPGEDYEEYRWWCLINDGEFISLTGEAGTVEEVMSEVTLEVEMRFGEESQTD